MKYRIALFLLLALAGAQAQVGLPFPGPGTPHTSGGGSYSGPGDVSSGWKAFYSCARGFNAASVGAKACTICNASDVVCTDVTVGGTGFVTIPTIGGTNCATVGACTIKTYWDQSGAAACSSAACNTTQSTIGNRPTVVMSALGGLACGTNTSWNFPAVSGFVGFTQPYSSSAVLQAVTGSFTNGTNAYGGDGGNVGYYIDTAFGFYASANWNALTPANTSFNSIQTTATSLPRLVLNSTTYTGTTNQAGTAAFGTTIHFGSDAYHEFDGVICEYGVKTGNSTSDDTAITNNQHSSTNGYNF